MDGLTFVRQVRASQKPEIRRTKIVLISSDRSVATRPRPELAIADAFLSKPLQRDDLLAVIDNLLPPEDS
jgi:CheY-like chemotaxis protein